jgi:hypothetical protein
VRPVGTAVLVGEPDSAGQHSKIPMIYDLIHSKAALLAIKVRREYLDPDGPAPSTPTSLCTPRRRGSGGGGSGGGGSGGGGSVLAGAVVAGAVCCLTT